MLSQEEANKNFNRYMYFAREAHIKARAARKSGDKELFNACMAKFRAYSIDARRYYDMLTGVRPAIIDTDVVVEQDLRLLTAETKTTN